jgi:hypothetical protein
MNGHALHLIFSSLGPIKQQNISKDTAWKDLQFTYDRLFYSCTFLFLKWTKFWAIEFRPYETNCFLLFPLLKKECTIRCSAKSSAIYNEHILKRGNEKKKWFHLVSKKDIIFAMRNLISQNFVHFENKRVTKK